MGDLLPREDEEEDQLICIRCGSSADFEYMYRWNDDYITKSDFRLCLGCAKMLGSNIIQDVLRKEIGFKPLGNFEKFIELLKEKFS